MKTFLAPWGFMLLLISAMGTLGLGLASWIMYYSPVPLWVRLIPEVALLSVIPFVVRGYRITPDAIDIPRLFWTTRIPRAGLMEAVIEPGVMKGSLKLFGNGGLYAFNGYFWNRTLGRYRAFVNDPARTVVLRFADRTVVVAPDDPKAFVRELLAGTDAA